jgi:hypothetical protein
VLTDRGAERNGLNYKKEMSRHSSPCTGCADTPGHPAPLTLGEARVGL